MICFQIEINGEKVCTAAVGDFGVLTVTLAWVGKRDDVTQDGPNNSGIALNVGGLTDPGSGQDEFVDWIRRRLAAGDQVRITILEDAEYDEPRERRQYDSAELAARAREHYEQIKLESESYE